MQNPLKDALNTVDIQSVRTAQRSLIALQDELDHVEQCGVDCQAIREMLQQKIAEANKIVERYGEGKY